MGIYSFWEYFLSIGSYNVGLWRRYRVILVRFCGHINVCVGILLFFNLFMLLIICWFCLITMLIYLIYILYFIIHNFLELWFWLLILIFYLLLNNVNGWCNNAFSDIHWWHKLHIIWHLIRWYITHLWRRCCLLASVMSFIHYTFLIHMILKLSS